MAKLTVTAELIVKPDCILEASQLLNALANDSLQEQGCEGYQLLVAQDQCNRFSTMELWANEAAEQLHWQTVHLKKTVNQLQDFLQEAAVIKKYYQLN